MDLIQILLGELHQKLARLTNLVPRDIQFPEAADKIKVAIGMRRVGKTYALYQHILKLLETGASQKTILYINFEDDRLLPLDEKRLAGLVDDFYTLYPENHEKKCFLFFDEIQNVPHWPLVIRRLHDTKNVEIFLTGSSAKMLSREIATSLRGRSLAIEIWPYSFVEFIRAKKSVIDRALFDQKTRDHLHKLFREYLSQGGFPEVTSYTPDLLQKTLQEYLDIAIYRDVIERHSIKNPALIKYMALSMIHNVAKPFTINKFYNDVKGRGYSISKDHLYEYAHHLEDAYMAFLTPLYDLSVRKVQANPKKIYTIDMGFTRSLTLDYENDLGRLFENLVYLDLRRLGYKIHYYLTSDRYEVDFLVQTPKGEKKLIQVAWDVTSKGTLEREQRALDAAKKELNVEGELITLDSYLQNGI